MYQFLEFVLMQDVELPMQQIEPLSGQDAPTDMDTLEPLATAPESDVPSQV